ncbi:MAG: transcription elongation factor GreA [Eubacteriales bacterium]
MENEKKTLYTEEGYKNLVDELTYLKDVRIPEIKTQLAEARAFGDLSENSEYDEAKNEQAKTVTRIAELEKLINEAAVIDESEIKADVVNLGSVVKVYDCDLEEEVEYSIVGSNEANPLQGRISDQSPIGSAMLGAKVGEEVVVAAPAGEYKLRILEVSRAKNL